MHTFANASGSDQASIQSAHTISSSFLARSAIQAHSLTFGFSERAGQEIRKFWGTLFDLAD
jgi:hypothetical protein